MSINFATLQGLTIPEGVVTQIADASGRVLWMLSSGKVVLEVEKITSDTYAAETTYTGEQFILLDIYPKTNGTVSVTYGGLTKTIMDTSGAAEPNAQQVYFGTFNGVSDSVVTPASGELTIEGDYYAFGYGTYATSKVLTSNGCRCITAIKQWGKVTFIQQGAFSAVLGAGYGLRGFVNVPNSITGIGISAFSACTKLSGIRIGKNVSSIGTHPSEATSLGASPFGGCLALADIVVDSNNQYYSAEDGVLYNKNKSTIVSYPSASGDVVVPNTVSEIWNGAFSGCNPLISITMPESIRTIRVNAFASCVNLENVNMLATTPPTISTLVFDSDSESFTITVPKGCGASYKAAEGWSTYADYIVEAS